MDESNPMSQQLNQHQQLIASYTGKMLRDHFGKVRNLCLYPLDVM